MMKIQKGIVGILALFVSVQVALAETILPPYTASLIHEKEEIDFELPPGIIMDWEGEDGIPDAYGFTSVSSAMALSFVLTPSAAGIINLNTYEVPYVASKTGKCRITTEFSLFGDIRSPGTEVSIGQGGASYNISALSVLYTGSSQVPQKNSSVIQLYDRELSIGAGLTGIAVQGLTKLTQVAGHSPFFET